MHKYSGWVAVCWPHGGLLGRQHREGLFDNRAPTRLNWINPFEMVC
jgi:hypothetical protein